MSQTEEFPRYLINIDGKYRFLTFTEACVACGLGFCPVEFGCYVLNEDFSVREMTSEDRRKISDVVDERDRNK